MCSFLWKGHKNSLIETLQSLLRSDTLSDCTIAAGGQYLKAHKVILAASSPYFKLLFSQEREKNPIVVLKDVNFQELKCIIEYIYKGEVEVPSGQVKSFLQTADSLQIVGLLGSGQEKVDEEDTSNSVSSNTPIAHKQKKLIHQEANSKENTPDQAQFRVTDESPEISSFGVSAHSNNCSVPPLHFKEKCVDNTSGIHNIVENFGASSSESRVPNIVGTNHVIDNNPIVPYANEELIGKNEEDYGLSNLCDSSETLDVSDNTAMSRRMETQTESVVNPFPMQQEPFLIIKQDPDSFEISEEHFEEGMGYRGGDFLERNSTVGPQSVVIDAPHAPDELDRSGFIVVQHVESLFCEDEVQQGELERFFEESERGVGNISASFQPTLRSEDYTMDPPKRPRGRPRKRRRQNIAHALSCARDRLPMKCDENEIRLSHLGPFPEYCDHSLTSCEAFSDPLSMTQLSSLSMPLSEVNSTAPLKRAGGRPPKKLSNQKISPLKRPRGRPRKNKKIRLARRRLCASSRKVLSKYLLFSQRRLRDRPPKSAHQRQDNVPKTNSKNSQAPSMKAERKDNISLGLPIKKKCNIVNSSKRSRGRPRKRVGGYLNRPRDRPSEALSKYLAFPSPMNSHNHSSKASLGENIPPKRPRGRPPKTSPNEGKFFNKRSQAHKNSPCKILKQDKIKEDCRLKTSDGVTTPLKRPRGRPRKTLSECSVTPTKRRRGRPPKRLSECNMPMSSHSPFKMSGEGNRVCHPGYLMNENIPPLGNSYELQNERNAPLDYPSSNLIQSLIEDNVTFGEGSLGSSSQMVSENPPLCSSPPKQLEEGDNVSSQEDLLGLRSKTLSEESITSLPVSGDTCGEHQWKHVWKHVWNMCGNMWGTPSITLSENNLFHRSGNNVSSLEFPRCPSLTTSIEESISRRGSPCQPPLD